VGISSLLSSAFVVICRECFSSTNIVIKMGQVNDFEKGQDAMRISGRQKKAGQESGKVPQTGIEPVPALLQTGF
jgi:hypothetical protein